MELHYKWLIYTLGGSIYPVHGWSIVMNLSSVDRQPDVSSENTHTHRLYICCTGRRRRPPVLTGSTVF